MRALSQIRALGAMSVNPKAALLMFLSCIVFSITMSVIRHLSASIPPLELVFFRNFFGLLAIVPLFLRTGFAPLRTKRFGLHVLRGLATLVAMVGFFTAIAVMPLADAVALGFTTPLFVTIGAVLFLSETVRLRRWTATGIGFLGAMVVLRPGFAEVSVASLLLLLSAAAVACSVILIKILARTESVRAIIAYMGLLVTPASLIPALFVWVWPSLEEFGWLVVLGTLATAGHLCVARALALADASAVMPIDFTKLPITALIAYVAFSEVADVWTWVGAAVIFGASIYIAHRESKVPPPTTERPVTTGFEARGEPLGPQP